MLEVGEPEVVEDLPEVVLDERATRSTEASAREPGRNRISKWAVFTEPVRTRSASCPAAAAGSSRSEMR